MAQEKILQLLNLSRNRSQGCFEALILQNTTINRTWTDEGSRVFIEFSLPVLPEFNNSYGTLHGGAITTMIDELTALAVWTRASRSLPL